MRKARPHAHNPSSSPREMGPTINARAPSQHWIHGETLNWVLLTSGSSDSDTDTPQNHCLNVTECQTPTIHPNFSTRGLVKSQPFDLPAALRVHNTLPRPGGRRSQTGFPLLLCKRSRGPSASMSSFAVYGSMVSHLTQCTLFFCAAISILDKTL